MGCFENMNILETILVIILMLICGVILWDMIKLRTSNTVENFQPQTCPTGTGSILATRDSKNNEPSQVRIIRISDTEFEVRFNYSSNSQNRDLQNSLVSQFIIVLLQYNYSLEPVGEIKILVSDESSKSTTQICSLNILGSFSCGHRFSNVAKLDNDGKHYIYRVGVASIGKCNLTTPVPTQIKNEISVFVEPQNIPLVSGKRMFTMEKDFKIPTEFETELSPITPLSQVSGTSNTDFLNEGIDSQYTLLSKQLGGYPYNVILDSKSSSQNLLADLVDKSLADNVVNIQLS